MASFLKIDTCHPSLQFVPDPRFTEACDFVRSKAFGDYDYQPLLDSLEGNSGFGRGDYFLVGRDFATYLEVRLGPASSLHRRC